MMKYTVMMLHDWAYRVEKISDNVWKAYQDDVEIATAENEVNIWDEAAMHHYRRNHSDWTWFVAIDYHSPGWKWAIVFWLNANPELVLIGKSRFDNMEDALKYGEDDVVRYYRSFHAEND